MRAGLRRLATCSLAAAVATGCTLVPLTILAPVAHAAEEVYGVPGDRQWSVQGRGWGHGRGMSQYGANGQAQQGRSAAQILDFYYPGTASTHIGDPQVRVQLTVMGGAPTTVSPQPGLRMVDFATGAEEVLPTDANRGGWRVRSDGGGMYIEWLDRTANVWKAHFLAGQHHRVTGPVRFTDDTGQPMTALLPAGGSRQYLGALLAVPVGGGLMNTVSAVPMQAYLRGVVPEESPASWPIEALKAQAVAARTYAFARLKGDSAQWDLCDSTLCQVYTGIGGHEASTDRAIGETGGSVRTYGGRPIDAQFSSGNGGWTVDGGQPYLPAKADPYDSAGNPRHTWQLPLRAADLERAYPQVGSLQRLVVVRRNGNGEWGGRVLEVRLEGTAGSARVTGEGALRFGMYSSWWQPAAPAPTSPSGGASFGGGAVGGVGSWYYLNDANSGQASRVLSYGEARDEVYVADTDGAGGDSLLIRRGNQFFVRNSLTSGPAQSTFVYGNAGDTVLVGDWDGDGVDTLAVRRGNVFYVKNSVTSGTADAVIGYGNPGDTVLVGDWDGDGVDTLAVRRGNVFYVKNSISTGGADQVVGYGDPGDTVLVGRWNGRASSLAVRRGNTYYLKNTLGTGTADTVFGYGENADTVLVGDWNGDGTDTLGVRRIR